MIELRVAAGAAAASSLTQVKLIATRFPGEHELAVIVSREQPVDDGPGEFVLTLGREWLYDGSPACMAALNEFGVAGLVDADR